MLSRAAGATAPPAPAPALAPSKSHPVPLPARAALLPPPPPLPPLLLRRTGAKQVAHSPAASRSGLLPPGQHGGFEQSRESLNRSLVVMSARAFASAAATTSDYGQAQAAPHSTHAAKPTARAGAESKQSQTAYPRRAH